MLVSTILQLLEENIQNMQSSVYSNFLPQELANQFDRIANKFVDTKLNPSLAGSLKGYDELQADLDDLSYVIAEATLTSTGNSGGDYFFTLPDDYRNLVNDKVDYVSCNGVVKNSTTYLTGLESWESVKLNPFLKPKETRLRSNISTNKFTVNAGGGVCNLAHITYIRKILPLDVVTPNAEYVEFPEHTILKLIDLTRNRISEIVQSERLATGVQEINNFGTLS